MSTSRTSISYTFTISQSTGESIPGSIVIDDPDNDYSPFVDSDYDAAVDAYIGSLLSAVSGTTASNKEKTVYSNDRESF